MSRRHFKRLKLNQSLAKTKKNIQAKEVCISSTFPGSNTLINFESTNITESYKNETSVQCLELQLPVSDSLEQNYNNISCNKKPTIREKLHQWVLDSAVTKNSVNSLLTILRSEGLNLPKDVRTLMNTPRNHNIITINPGTYIHLGLEKMMYFILKLNSKYLRNIDEIFLSFNIDGLPLFKTTILANTLFNYKCTYVV